MLSGTGADTNLFTSIASSILARPRAVHAPGEATSRGNSRRHSRGPSRTCMRLPQQHGSFRPVFGPDRRYGSSNSDSQDSPSVSIPTRGTIDASNPPIHAIATSKSSARWNRCRFRSSQTCSLNKASRTPCEWIARQPLRPSPGSLPDLLLDLCAAHQPARWRCRPVQA